MKQLIFAMTTVFALIFSSNLYSQVPIEVKSNGDVFFDGTTVKIKNSSNRVGIGTEWPAAKLHVNGTFKSKNITVDDILADDFVGDNVTGDDFYGNRFRPRGAATQIRLQTPTGYLKLGPHNTGYSHFFTDRARYYFDKEVFINGHHKPYVSATYNSGHWNKRWKTGYFVNVNSTNNLSLSDRNVKENFRNLENPLAIIQNLSGQIYDYKTEVFMPGSSDNSAGENTETKSPEEISKELKEKNKLVAEAEKMRKNHYGFIAQEVKQVLPDVVTFDDDTGLHSMNYNAIIPILVEAIKEQQLQIEALKELIKD